MNDAPKDLYEETEALLPEAVEALEQEEKLSRLTQYRGLINEGRKFNQIAYQNALLILRSVRTRAIKSNAYAKKGAKKKAEVAQFDLSALIKQSQELET